MHAVHARRVRPGALARARQEVGPSGLVAARELAAVLVAERGHRRQRHRHGLVDRVAAVDLLDERRVQVLVPERGEAEHPLAQRQVPVQRRQVRVDVLDELAIDAHGDVVMEHRRLEARGEVVHVGVEDVGLELRVQRRAHRALEPLQRREERLEDLQAVGALGRGARSVVPGGVEANLLARRQLHRGVGEIGVLEHAVDRAGRAREVARHREQALLGGAQRVRLPAQHVVEEEGPGLEARLLRERAANPRGRQLEQLGAHPGRRRVELDREALRLGAHGAGLGRARVLVVARLGVDADALELVLQRAELRERVAQAAGAVAEVPLEAREGLHAGGERRLGLGPRRVGRKEIVELPAVRGGGRAGRGGGSCCRGGRARGGRERQRSDRNGDWGQGDLRRVAGWLAFGRASGSVCARLGLVCVT